MSIVQRSILEHLGAAGVLLVVGCREPGQPTAEPSASSAATTAATATPEPTATSAATATVVAATATPEPTATSAATATPAGTGAVGAVCKTEHDCQAGLHCQLGFDGAKFSETGVCTKERPVYRGRPLLVGGEARVAVLDRASLASDAVAWAPYFARAAVEEHASVAAFARTLCQLMALGAPLALLERTQAALADELEHTRGSLAWLARFVGEEAAPGPLPEALAPLASTGAEGPAELSRALLLDVVRGGCVGEALAADAMLERAADARDPELGAWLRRVADDEARHAALAFETALWLVGRFPELAAVVEEEHAALDPVARQLVGPLFESTGLVARASA